MGQFWQAELVLWDEPNVKLFCDVKLVNWPVDSIYGYKIFFRCPLPFPHSQRQLWRVPNGWQRNAIWQNSLLSQSKVNASNSIWWLSIQYSCVCNLPLLVLTKSFMYKSCCEISMFMPFGQAKKITSNVKKVYMKQNFKPSARHYIFFTPFFNLFYNQEQGNSSKKSAVYIQVRVKIA